MSRAHGRRLDLLASLPAEDAISVFESDYPDTPQVDEKLMRLATDVRSSLVTVDYNLAKVARVRGIEVVNRVWKHPASQTRQLPHGERPFMAHRCGI